jgi:hypothetical protein
MGIYGKDKIRKIFLIVYLVVILLAFQLKAVEISVDSVSSSTVGLYEKFEIYVALDAVYSNPYDPEEIDVRAVFTSPAAQQWTINGFFDNYNSASKWKVRFSPNETGTWTYRLIATDIGGTDSSDASIFEATSSGYHGWIRVSPDNPRYLMHDDGTSFYGVGVYYPWGVNNGTGGLGKFTTYGMNIFGYWNSTYDGSGNGGGYYQIEDFRTGIGIYNQNKCARIDELLTWSEGRDIKMMFAIFPHDILSATVWSTDWDHNAYSTICDADDFYGDSLAWEYQKKQFRYIIARWGYSRALCIWEIVNEINGTDGWQHGHVAEAEGWFGKVHKYLVESDPYGRPATGSKSGGIWDYWWPNGLQYMDLANIHLYERQGWTLHYPGDTIRSGLWNCISSVQRLRNNYTKPAIFGETGAEHAYATFGTYEYTIEYHNALWGSLTNGLAIAPVWWSYPSHVDDAMLYQARCFGRFISGVDFAHRSLDSIGVAVADCDAYALGNDTFALGWARETSGDYIGYKSLTLNGLQDREYVVKWFDCWEGEVIDEENIICSGGVLSATIPYLDSADIAFKVLTLFESGVAEEEHYAGELKLLGNLPNPFTNSTAISYILTGQLKVSVKIYNVSGRLIANPVAEEVQGPGKQTLQWDARDALPGIYFYRIEAGDGEYVKSGKCILLR